MKKLTYSELLEKLRPYSAGDGNPIFPNVDSLQIHDICSLLGQTYQMTLGMGANKEREKLILYSKGKALVAAFIAKLVRMAEDKHGLEIVGSWESKDKEPKLLSADILEVGVVFWHADEKALIHSKAEASAHVTFMVEKEFTTAYFSVCLMERGCYGDTAQYHLGLKEDLEKMPFDELFKFIETRKVNNVVFDDNGGLEE